MLVPINVFWLGRIVAAIPAVYLVLVGGLGTTWKALLVPVIVVAVVGTYVPRASCADEGSPSHHANQTEARDCNG